ncbi:MAG TPA: hypothetical protein PL117_03265 [Accumulibacter sp.]|uniref:hypothetical protein n=1 Tax=Accumulibacter sp. TaxID=2053492 RepID=UPI002C5FF6FB|nr:hypothetical protein [Accumulibacter sp.]HRF71767.1 hypothetical protein [Accumulibacter sp.]
MAQVTMPAPSLEELRQMALVDGCAVRLVEGGHYEVRSIHTGETRTARTADELLRTAKAIGGK